MTLHAHALGAMGGALVALPTRKRPRSAARRRIKSRIARETAYTIDHVVGERLRERRADLGLTQKDVGEAIDLTYQQVQKYERGIDRISASTLFHMAVLLRVPISYFFQGLNPAGLDDRFPERTRLVRQLQNYLGMLGASDLRMLESMLRYLATMQ
jgi:transcriptional regulator with XRE-family HTH domain